jgi:peroxiredoxin
LAQLRQDYDKFVEQDVVILVVGPEDREKFRAYWEVESLPYTGLPDPKGRVLKLFGQEVNLFKLGRMPAQAIVDKQGMARYVHYGKSMQDIPSNEELLQLLESLNAEKVG